MKKIMNIGLIILMNCVFSSVAGALNISGSANSQTQELGSDQGKQVEVTNLPIQVITKKINGEDTPIPYLRVQPADYFIQEIGKEITLGAGEVYESEPFDVREYRECAIYVIPDTVLGSQTDSLYQTDAYFSITPATQKIQKMGEKAGKQTKGWQEFGNMKVDSSSKTETESFMKLSTGQTSSRVLFTKIYGPFIQVALKNLTPDSKRKFKITAYLTR